MAVQHETRILFLKNFTSQLIINSKPQPIYKEVEVNNYEVLVPSLKPTQPDLPGFSPSLISSPRSYKIKTLSVKDTPIQPKSTPKSGYDKISPLIDDPLTTTIECPGAEKYLIANIAGKIITTKISLSKREIKEILGKLSTKSKTPIGNEMFRMQLNNMTITGVISEIAGTRFIISKNTS